MSLNDEQIVDIYKQIGKNVKQIRKERGISQLSLSLSIGHKAVGTISMAENLINKKHFNIEHLAKISKVLNVDICTFFQGIDCIIEEWEPIVYLCLRLDYSSSLQKCTKSGSNIENIGSNMPLYFNMLVFLIFLYLVLLVN